MPTTIFIRSSFVVLLPFVAAMADEPTIDVDQSEEIEQLIAKFDDDQFRVREAASRRLLEIGPPSLPALLRRREGASYEVRLRVARIAERISQELLSVDFARLAAQPADAKIDLDKGMWLIARIGNPLVRREDLSAQLDGLAAAVQRQLGDVTPANADPKQVVEALRLALFAEDGFKGVMPGESPDNSSLEMVLRNKRGLPILLSHVVVAVAERLRVPVVGLAMPYRYMVKYDGSRAPAGFPGDDIILDPYNGCKVVPRGELAQAIGLPNDRLDLEAHLVPSPKRHTLWRMLQNL
ncbi:MAG TPA: transglutaminase family protein, partial [Pirellulales bacterium]|nr:transglutaminase family protein [Pirellulales bacterium]